MRINGYLIGNPLHCQKRINTYVAGYGCLVIMKSSTPNNDKIKETDPIIRCSRLEKASSKMPNSIVKITKEKIMSLKIIVSCEIATKRQTQYGSLVLDQKSAEQLISQPCNLKYLKQMLKFFPPLLLLIFCN